MVVWDHRSCSKHYNLLPCQHIDKDVHDLYVVPFLLHHFIIPGSSHCTILSPQTVAVILQSDMINDIRHRKASPLFYVVTLNRYIIDCFFILQPFSLEKWMSQNVNQIQFKEDRRILMYIDNHHYLNR